MLALAPSVSHATQADVDAELAALIRDFDSGTQELKPLVERRIKWTGITDPRLFDRIDQRLMSECTRVDFGEGEDCGWMAQALAFSGQEKYRARLDWLRTSTDSGKLVRHLESSLEALPVFARWNPMISAGLEQAPPGGLRKARVMNMLRAADPKLARAGASFVYDEFSRDREVTDLVRDRLLALYREPAYADVAAWLCKALGQSGNRDYLPVLRQVRDAGTRSSVQRWAESAIGELGG